MNPTHDTLEASYDFCRRLSRRAGSSFYAGFLLLPREKRRAMNALYAFMRHTDDLADDPAPVDLRREALMAWQTELECSLGDNKSPVPLGKGQVEIVGNERQEMRNNEPLVPPSAFRPLPARPVLTVTLSQENWGSEILPAVADTGSEIRHPPPTSLCGDRGRRDGSGGASLRDIRRIADVLRARGVGRRVSVHPYLGIFAVRRRSNRLGRQASPCN